MCICSDIIQCTEHYEESMRALDESEPYLHNPVMDGWVDA